MSVQISGPRLPAATGKADSLVIFCHGYGADGNDLIGLGQHWQRILPNTAFASPHAPERCAMSPMGYQWFGISRLDPQDMLRGVEKAAPVLEAFIHAELARTHVNPSRLALVGFSQGTMMALHVGLRRRRAPAAIVGYSGVLVGPEHLAEATARSAAGAPPPVLLVHGDQDDVIPVDALFMSAEELAKAEIPCQWHLSVGVAHGIDGGGLMHGGLFIAAGLGEKVAR